MFLRQYLPQGLSIIHFQLIQNIPMMSAVWEPYRGILLIRNCLLLKPYRRTMPWVLGPLRGWVVDLVPASRRASVCVRGAVPRFPMGLGHL